MKTSLEDDEIDILEYLRVLLKYKFLIVSFSILGAAIAIGIGFSQSPIYKIEAVLAPVSDEQQGSMSSLLGQFGGLASLAGIAVDGAGSNVQQEALATLNSRAFLDQFIKANGLHDKLSGNGAVGRWSSYEYFISLLSVTEDKKSGMISFSLDWVNAEEGARLANELISQINQHMRLLAVKEAQKSIAYLEKELAKTAVVEMRQAIFRLIEAQTKNIMLANVREEFVFKVIDPAVAPDYPYKPKKKLLAVLGLFSGFMVAVFLSLLLNYLSKLRTESKNGQ